MSSLACEVIHFDSLYCQFRNKIQLKSTNCVSLSKATDFGHEAIIVLLAEGQLDVK